MPTRKLLQLRSDLVDRLCQEAELRNMAPQRLAEKVLERYYQYDVARLLEPDYALMILMYVGLPQTMLKRTAPWAGQEKA